MLSRGEGGASRGGDFDFWPGVFVKIPIPGQHILSKFTKKLTLHYTQMMIFIQQILHTCMPFYGNSTDKNLTYNRFLNKGGLN